MREPFNRKTKRNERIGLLYYTTDKSASEVAKVILEEYGDILSRQAIHAIAKRYEKQYGDKQAS